MGSFFYVVRCSDRSLYAGITTSIERRVKAHNTGNKGAKYTRSRRPVSLVIDKKFDNKSEALKYEISFKKLSKRDKEKICLRRARMKTKYAIPKGLVDDLLLSGMASSEGEALEKVASGEALEALLANKSNKLRDLETELKSFGGFDNPRRARLSNEEMGALEADIEEINELLTLRDATKLED